jgi:transcriptional regulator, crp family
MTVGTNDSPCACGKRGCLETLASVPALCESAGVSDIAELRAAVLSGDTRAREALARAAQAVGYVLGSAALLINPRAIIVAGEIVDAFPSLRSDIAASMYGELLPVMEWDIDVVGASLGPLGAAQASAYIAAHPFEEDAPAAHYPGEGSPRQEGPASSLRASIVRGERP